MTVVVLGQLEGIAELVGEAGKGRIVSTGGRDFLSGTFALRLAGLQSEFTDLTAIGPEVVITGGRVSLKAIRRSIFTFDPILTIQRGVSDPWLAATKVALALDSTANSSVLLSLDDASVSVIPDLPPTAAQLFHYPSRNGAAFTALTPLNVGGIFGFFVVPLDEGGFGVRFGNFGASAEIDHHFVTGVVIPREAMMTFRLTPPAAVADHDVVPQPLLIRGDLARSNLVITLADSTEGILPQRTGGVSSLRCGRIEIGEGWLSVTEMHPSQPEVAVTRLNTTAVADSTKILARPKRLRYHLPLAFQNGAPVHLEPPHFTYRDVAIEQGGVSNVPRERHHGLRIRGLYSSTGGQAKLDANWAVAAVEGGKLHFHAGGEVRVRGVVCRSVVLPKVDALDRETRSLTIPAGVMELRCVVPVMPSLAYSPIIFDTRMPEDKRLHMHVTLAVPPSGTPGVTPGAPGKYSRWELQAQDNVMIFRVSDEGVFPAGGIGWPGQFTGEKAEFALVENPGTRLVLNPTPHQQPDAFSAWGITPRWNTTSVTTVSDAGSAKEILVYSGVSAILILREKIFEYFLEVYAANIEDDKVRVELQQLDDQSIFKNREVDSLLAVFCDEAPGGQGDDEIRRFIANNTPAGKTQLVWAFAPGLSLLMWDQHGHQAAPFCFDVARARKPDCRPGMALDLSSIKAFEFADFGWTEQDILRFKADPLLWPRLSGSSGARLDPSDSAWRGVVFRDLPLILAVNPNEVNAFAPEFVRRFYDKMNSYLMLDYGWKDETGTTWCGGFEDPSGISIAPDSWKSVLDVQFLRFSTRGSAGRIFGAEGELRVVLPRIVSRDVQKRPLSFTGRCSINVEKGVKLEQIEFSQEDPEDFGTGSIPGFNSVQVVRFSSNLETMLLTLRLTPSDALAVALPFLGAGQTLDVTSLVPLRGNGVPQWAFTLGSEIQTNLFGRFATTIQGLELRFRKDDEHSANVVVMQVRIHLGAASFASVGARLVLTEQTDGIWSLDVQLEEISGSIDVGDFCLRGTLAWSTERGDVGAVPSTDITNGLDRDFWGEIALDTGGLIGQQIDGQKGQQPGGTSMLLRIGNRGELSYWIGAMRAGELGFGPAATIRKPGLLVAHNADFGGNLRNLLSDVQTSIAAAVRPPDTGVNRAWLASWEPSADIGTVVAGSGFLNVHDVVAAAPNNPKKDDLTCLVVTDSGLFRAEATILLFETARARVGLAVDLTKKRFTAGIQVPEIKYAAFTVSAGQIAIGLGWGEPYFLLSGGWPEAIGGDAMNRDWSKSVMVRWDGSFPLNTFMGGVRAEFLQSSMIVGFALRAGWTAEYKVGGEVAGGEASLGVMIGGLVEIYFGSNGAPRLLAPTAPRALLAAAYDARNLVAKISAARVEVDNTFDPLADILQFAVPYIEALMPAMAESNVSARVVFFGDIWGKASVYLLGVTLGALDVGAHAAFVGCIRFAPDLEIARLAARISLHVSAKIGCVTVESKADIDITVRDLGGPCLPSDTRPPGELSELRKALA